MLLFHCTVPALLKSVSFHTNPFSISIQYIRDVRLRETDVMVFYTQHTQHMNNVGHGGDGDLLETKHYTWLPYCDKLLVIVELLLFPGGWWSCIFHLFMRKRSLGLPVRGDSCAHSKWSSFRFQHTSSVAHCKGSDGWLDVCFPCRPEGARYYPVKGRKLAFRGSLKCLHLRMVYVYLWNILSIWKNNTVVIYTVICVFYWLDKHWRFSFCPF